MSWWAKLTGAASILLCLWIARYPYAFAFGKIGSGWATWPDYTRIIVVQQTAMVALPEIAALCFALRALARHGSRSMGYLLLLIAPMLGVGAFLFSMKIL